MKDYVVKVEKGSMDQVRVERYLEKMGIKYSLSSGILNGAYIHFDANKATWKRVKKDLDLVIESVYCKLEES